MRAFRIFVMLSVAASCMAKDVEIISPNLYVAPDGSDSNPGTIDKPFATLTRARDAVREFKKGVPKPVTVFVREGTYYLGETLVFGIKDCGTDLQPITYAAYKEEKPVISGGAKLDVKWKPYRNGIMKCSVPKGMDFDQLFINGKRQRRARYPNFDPTKPLVTEGGSYISGSVSRDGDKVWLNYDPKSFTKKKWADPQTGIVHYFPGSYYFNLQFELKDLDYSTNTIFFGKGGWQRSLMQARWGPNDTIVDCFKIVSNIGDGYVIQCPFFVDNIFEELDIASEWFLDKKTDTLYYMPEAGGDLKNAKVEVSQLKHLVEIKGSRAKPVSNIHFDGFQFAHSSKTFLEPYITPSSGDFGVYWGGAVFIEGAEYCSVKNSLFHEIGGNGVFIGGYNRHIKVYGNTFTYCGDNAVCVIGKSHEIFGTAWTCPQCGDTRRMWDFGKESKDIPAYCDVSNNHIHHIGTYGKQVTGVLQAMTIKNTISHNHIHHVPRSAICTLGPFWGGHVVEYNDLHDTTQETTEHGTLSSWGRSNYWCLGHWAPSPDRLMHTPGDIKRHAKFTTHYRYNRIREKLTGYVRGRDVNMGINFDDGSANYHVYNNLCLGTGMQNREGSYRIVENNIFIEPQTDIRYEVGFRENHDRFARNIVVIREDKVGYYLRFFYDKGPYTDQMDYNLFYRENPSTGPFSYSVGKNIPIGDTNSWIVTKAQSGAVYAMKSGWVGMNATDGDYFLHLGDSLLESEISQTFATKPGKKYKLSFDAWQIADHANDGSLDVKAGDLAVNDLAVACYAKSGASHFEYTFKAKGADTTLSFHNNGDVRSAINIDNVSVVSGSDELIVNGSFEQNVGQDGERSFEWSDANGNRYDTHSLLADPMFVDPENGDYRVRPESPALKLGFKNFDMDSFGLLPDFPTKWEQ